ncbi:dynein axonemal assembly factor 6 isoform X1 [Gallus gallus]|uniref:dynein axonemal assembly factor 6 isoform X1 n=1 Tax=Gallus gallus TaxID=9031 RepID=UPI00003AD426|nr:dynein axonemal assembly factor 6 isoform X1 [Gallus gallus]XP_420180.3 dynein axonemal assembly factor 6 isoform X1 [Gallus gallus]|eukprot:XP_420180.3 protein PIH1D3 [Gallus gallus]
MDVGVSSVSSLQSLAKLLGGAHGDEDDDDFGPCCSASAMTPGSIGPVKKETADILQLKSEHSKTIWSTEEVPEGSEFDDTWDPREQPEYEILFKQHVGTEDVFFGMSRKDPSTACCEDMVVKIKLPETKFSDITLDIQDKVLDLRTPQKKLLLHLPCPVDSKKGKARFLSEEELLEVTLRMRREFDFINFA